VIGGLRKDLETALCFFDLFILLKSGIPLDSALGHAGASGRGLTGLRMEECRDHLRAGHTFSGALAHLRYFPRLVVDTIRLGEEMGRYDDHCQRVFKLYYRSFETRVNSLAAALQPVVLGVCALFIAAMAFAFLRPIYANLTQMGTLKP
jgi:type II secretory pathway component PulF